MRAIDRSAALAGEAPRCRSGRDGADVPLPPPVFTVLAIAGIRESDTGLAPPSQWDLISDKQMMQEEQPLQVARCTKIINAGTDEAQYVINIKQIAKFVVGLGDRVSPTDIEEGMRVGVDRNKYQIQVRRIRPPASPSHSPARSLAHPLAHFLARRSRCRRRSTRR